MGPHHNWGVHFEIVVLLATAAYFTISFTKWVRRHSQTALPIHKIGVQFLSMQVV